MSTDFFTDSKFTLQSKQPSQPPEAKRKPSMNPKMTNIASGEILLSSNPELVKLQNKLQALLTLPKEVPSYDALCGKLLQSFAEFVQTLPITQDGFYSNQGGILLHALDKACIASNKCRTYLLPHSEPDNQQVLSSQHALWMYVVFSSSLLHRLGYFISKLKVTLLKGADTQLWEPLEGAMTQTGFKQFRFQFEKANDDQLARILTLYFARQLMPSQGFQWITQDSKIFKIWLMLLEENWQAAGSLSGMIPQALNESIANFYENKAYQKMLVRTPSSGQEQFGAQRNTESNFLQQPTTFAQEAFLNTQALTQSEAGIAFIKWLGEKISNQQVSFNKERSAVHVTREGVLLVFPETMQLIKDFLNDPKNNKKFGDSWQNVIEQVTQLGLTKGDANNNHVRQVKVGNEQKSIIKGILLNSVHAVFLEGTPPESKVPLAMINPKAVVTTSPQPAQDASAQARPSAPTGGSGGGR